MGGNIKVLEQDGINGAGPWNDVQVSDIDSADVRQRKLGGDRGKVEDPGGVSPLFGQTDCGDDIEMSGRQDVGISLVGDGARSRGFILHT